MGETALLTANLGSPVVLAFCLGIVARLLRSDLRVPDAIRDYLSLFLLLAIGLKGGSSLAGAEAHQVLAPALATVLAGIATCFFAFAIAQRFLRLMRVDAAAMAAHYGSASAVTFIAATQFVASLDRPADDWMVSMLVLLEIPAIVVALMIARSGGASGSAWREVLVGRASILLLGGLAIGYLAGPARLASANAMYVELFQGMLMLYLLDLGMHAADGLSQVRREGARLIVFGIALPLVHGALGTWIGASLGLGVGSATVLGALVASASYIAAPAAIRSSLPEAHVGRCVAAALGVTFPFNLAFGIPACYAFATILAART